MSFDKDSLFLGIQDSVVILCQLWYYRNFICKINISRNIIKPKGVVWKHLASILIGFKKESLFLPSYMMQYQIENIPRLKIDIGFLRTCNLWDKLMSTDSHQVLEIAAGNVRFKIKISKILLQTSIQHFNLLQYLLRQWSDLETLPYYKKQFSKHIY